jgi:3-oxocholest-4-en-26-oyl-CoA dehydrogenase beta subunit
VPVTAASAATAEDRRAIAELAGTIFHDLASAARVREVSRSAERIDRVLWSQLADSGLLGLTIPVEHGGAGLGLVELGILLEQQGRHVAPVPLLATLVLGALPVVAVGSHEQRRRLLPDVASGRLLITGAPFQTGRLQARPASNGRWRVSGSLRSVPFGDLADAAIVGAASPDGVLRLFIVAIASDQVRAEAISSTAEQPAAHLSFDETMAEPLGDAVITDAELRWIRDRVHVAAAALQLGVAESALEQAAQYVTERHQFGRPLGSFQAVAHQLADAHLQTAAMGTTLRSALARLDAGLDPGTGVLVARWWGCAGGERVTYTVQHVHGGLGADVDYPVHRYFLWSRELSQSLGGGPQLLAELGDMIAARAEGVPIEDLEDAMHGALERPAWT